MSKQNVTTKIQFPSDFQITAAAMKLTVEDRLALACALLGKNITDYTHLDRGRQSMTANNMLRGAGRKDPDFVVKVQEAAKELAAAYPEGFDPIKDTRPARAKKAKVKVAKINYPMNWPKSKRFAFARLVDGQWNFSYTRKTEGDIMRPEGI